MHLLTQVQFEYLYVLVVYVMYIKSILKMNVIYLL